MSQAIIDDQDLTKVKYTGTWLRGGSSHENAGTVASSTNDGDYFTVTFQGTSIAVYGTIDSTSGGVLTNYSLDSAPPEQATSQAGSGDTYRQQFWSSKTLALKDHTLTVTMAKVNNDPEPGEGTIWFDYFVVVNPVITSPPASTNTTMDPTNDSENKTRVGAITGGIIGIIFLFAAVAFIFYYRRRRAAAAMPRPIFPPVIDTREIPSHGIQPYLLNVTTNPLPTKILMHQNHIHNTVEAGSSRHLSSTEASNMQAVSAELVQHVDSGIRTANAIPPSRVELPPVYSPV